MASYSPWVRDQDAERGEGPIANNHHMIEEGDQEAAIGAFLLAHEGHTQDVEIQRGTWSIYCRCARCEDIHTYEVDNEAREQALGLPPWPGLSTFNFFAAKKPFTASLFLAGLFLISIHLSEYSTAG